LTNGSFARSGNLRVRRENRRRRRRRRKKVETNKNAMQSQNIKDRS
jgi:hypothetical protein